MSAECSWCGNDMGYGPMGKPVCKYCALTDENERLKARCHQLSAVNAAVKKENERLRQVLDARP